MEDPSMLEMHIRVSRRLVYVIAAILVLGMIVPFLLSTTGGHSSGG